MSKSDSIFKLKSKYRVHRVYIYTETEFGLYSYMDEGRDGGEVKLELCPQLNTAAVESKK